MFEVQDPYAETRDEAPLPALPGSGRPLVTSDLHPITDALCFLRMRVIDQIPKEHFPDWSAAEVAQLKRACKKFERVVPGIADLYDAMLDARHGKREFGYSEERITEWETAWSAYRQNVERSREG